MQILKSLFNNCIKMDRNAAFVTILVAS